MNDLWFYNLSTVFQPWKADNESKVQSTLVISKSKGPSKTVRDIRTSTYQICSVEEKTI